MQNEIRNAEKIRYRKYSWKIRTWMLYSYFYFILL